MNDLEVQSPHRESAAWFSGWWHGIAIGLVIGAGATAAAMKSLL